MTLIVVFLFLLLYYLFYTKLLSVNQRRNLMTTLNKQHIVDIDLSDDILTLEHNNLTFYYSIIGLEDVNFFNDSYGVEGSAFINDNIDEVVSYSLTETLDEEENLVSLDNVVLDESSINEALSEKIYELHLKQSQYLD